MIRGMVQSILIGCLIGSMLAMVLPACGTPRPPPIPPPAPFVPPAPPPMDQPEADPVAALRSERDKLRGDLAAIDSRLKAAEQEATLAPLRALTKWAAYIGGAIAGLAVVALVLVRFGLGLPIGTRLILGIGAAGLVLASCAVGFGQILPWIGPIGIGLLVLVIVASLLWAALTWKRGGEAAASEWVRYASALDDERRRQLDALSQDLQGKAATIVNRLLPAPPTNNPGTR